MAKQTAVLKFPMDDAKKLSKAQAWAAGFRGVYSMSLDGHTMTVKGEGIYSMELTMLLRNKMSDYVDLFGVTTTVEKKKMSDHVDLFELTTAVEKNKEADKEKKKEMKRTVVIKLSKEDATNKPNKAMQCAAGLRGVRSVSLDDDTMTVEGVWIDSVELTRRLREKMSDHVDLFGVTTAVEKAKEKKEKKEKKKRTVVIKLYMEDDDKRTKAMRCAAGFHGVRSVSLEGDTMTITGERIDSADLTKLLKMKISDHVYLLGVTTAVEKKEKQEEEKKVVKFY